MSDQQVDKIFLEKLETLGGEATPGQADNLLNWILNNYAACYWMWCAEQCFNVGDIYTELSMRSGEMGC